MAAPGLISEQAVIRMLSTFHTLIQIEILYVLYRNWQGFKGSIYGYFFKLQGAGWFLILLARINEWWWEMGLGAQTPLHGAIFPNNQYMPPVNASGALMTFGIVLIAYGFGYLYRNT
ncbi:MAG: hypothetical protein SVV03_02935 [Candidatus Nanohaloarchaea archaeon]|nr:hypothetical protein [Candidatus Nanohaloarchaea archaeon]